MSETPSAPFCIWSFTGVVRPAMTQLRLAGPTGVLTVAEGECLVGESPGHELTLG